MCDRGRDRYDRRDKPRRPFLLDRVRSGLLFLYFQKEQGEGGSEKEEGKGERHPSREGGEEGRERQTPGLRLTGQVIVLLDPLLSVNMKSYSN